MNNRTRTSPKGFTLIELLVVIAIIAILIGIVLPAVNAARMRIYAAATQARINQLGTGADAYKAATDFYPVQLLLANLRPGDSNPIGQYVAGVSYFGSQIFGACVYGYTLKDIDDNSMNPLGTYLPCSTKDLLTLGVLIGTTTVQCRGLLTDKFGGMERSILYYPSRAGAAGLGQYEVNDNNRLATGTWYDYKDKTAGQSTFEKFIKDRRLGTGNPTSTSTTPYNPETYILLGPGIDRADGTADDLHNW